jgi:hypothetical protein
MVRATLVKNDDATLTFQAVEIEKVGGNMPLSSDEVGASPMYKAGMGYSKTDKDKVMYVRPTTEPYVS